MAAPTLNSLSPAGRADPPDDSRPAVPRLSITAPRRDDDREPDKRPLDLRLITRLIGHMRPYAARRNWLIAMVLVRSVQLPAIGWTIAAIINGPIDGRAPIATILWCAFGLLALAGSTQFVFHFRQ